MYDNYRNIDSLHRYFISASVPFPAPAVPAYPPRRPEWLRVVYDFVFFLPSEAVVKYSLTTEFLSNSLSFRMLLICMLMFGVEVAKSSAICNWLSGHTFQLMRSTLWFTANVRINEREISSLLEYFSLRVQVYSRFTANVRINSELSSTT